MIGSLSVRIVGIGLQFLVLVLVARALGPTEFGIYASGYAAAAIVSGLACFGLPTMLVKELSATSDGNRISILLRAYLRSGLQTFAVVFFAVGAFALLVPTSWAIIQVLLCLLPVLTFAQFRQSAALALQSTTRAFLPEQIAIPLLVLALLALSGGFSNRSLTSVLAATVIASGVVSLTASLHFWRRTSPGSGQHPAGPSLKSAFPFFLSQFPRLAFANIDILIANYFFDFEAAGTYALASRMAGLAGLPLFAVNAAVQPLFAKAFAEPTNRLDANDLAVAAGFLSLTGGLIAVGAILVFGPPFLAVATPGIGIPFQLLASLAAAQLVNCGFGPNGTILLMAGQERTAAIATWVQFVIFSAFAAGFALSGTLTSLALGVLAAMIVGNLVMTCLVWMKTGILLHPFAGRRHMQVGIAILSR